MMTYKEALERARRLLEQEGISDYEQDSWYMMEMITSFDKAKYLLVKDDAMPEGQAIEYDGLIKERCSHVPLQYIQGHTEFMGLKLTVNNNVLIPRQETELLVEAAGREYVRVREEVGYRIKVLDMCTGSGCIIVCLAKLYGAREAYGTDISREALDVAGKNARDIGVGVTFIQSDLFKEVKGRFDIIVSNPPYIRGADIGGLMPEVRLHEPMIALDGGDDGLWFYREIIKDAPHHLNPGGIVMFEIGYDQADDVGKIFLRHGFGGIDVSKDYAGYDRIMKARLGSR